MYQKPELVELGLATDLIKGTKQVHPEIANVEAEKDPESLFED